MQRSSTIRPDAGAQSLRRALRTPSTGKCDAHAQPYSRRSPRQTHASSLSLISREPGNSSLVSHGTRKRVCCVDLTIMLAITYDQAGPVALVSVKFGRDDTASSTALLRELILPCICKNGQLLLTTKEEAMTVYSPPDSDRAST